MPQPGRPGPAPGRAIRHRGRERGIALLAVVWVVALLAVMALDVLAAARREAGLASDHALRARLDAAAEAGIALAVHGLLAEAASPGPGQARRRGPRPVEPMEFEGIALAIAVEDEAGKIDLNQAPPRVLRGLFEALGLPAPRAAALAEAILDWRDTDEVPRPGGGAEAPQYRAALSPVPPRDGAFRSVEELVHVQGMTPDLLALAAPWLTVHAQREAVDRAVAGPVAMQAAGAAQAPEPPPALRRGGGGGGAATAEDGMEGRAFRIRVEARSAEGEARRVREAIVRLTGDRREPYWIHAFR